MASPASEGNPFTEWTVDEIRQWAEHSKAIAPHSRKYVLHIIETLNSRIEGETS